MYMFLLRSGKNYLWIVPVTPSFLELCHFTETLWDLVYKDANVDLELTIICMWNSMVSGQPLHCCKVHTFVWFYYTYSSESLVYLGLYNSHIMTYLKKYSFCLSERGSFKSQCSSGEKCFLGLYESKTNCNLSDRIEGLCFLWICY